MRTTVLKKFSKSEAIDPKWVLALRNRLQLSQERLARLLEVSTRTITRWERGEGRPDPLLEKKLLGVDRVIRKLEKAGEPEEIVAWLEKPDPDLRGYPPLDLLGSSYATDDLLDRIDEWGQEAE